MVERSKRDWGMETIERVERVEQINMGRAHLGKEGKKERTGK